MRHQSIRLDTIGKVLQDHNLFVRCSGCSNSRQLDAEQLIQQFGADYSLDRLANGLRCSRCGRRNAAISIVFRSSAAFKHGGQSAPK